MSFPLPSLVILALIEAEIAGRGRICPPFPGRVILRPFPVRVLIELVQIVQLWPAEREQKNFGASFLLHMLIEWRLPHLNRKNMSD